VVCFWAYQGLPEEVLALKGKSYATAYIDFCVSSLEQRSEILALQDFDAAIRYDGNVVTSLDTYYRISYANKELSRQHIDKLLAHLAETQSYLNIRRARGAAYRALGLACYHERRLSKSRRLWRQALVQSPGSFLGSSFGLLYVKSLLRSLCGQEATGNGVG
jgi:hypothetical protein